MPRWLKRGDPKSKGQYVVLLSSTHKGLQHTYKTKVSRFGYRTTLPTPPMPTLLQETINYFNGQEADVYEVLEQLEKAAIMAPGMWRAEIVLRSIRDPFSEDPNFDAHGYIMGLLIPEDNKKQMSYFRLLAFHWKKWRTKKLNGITLQKPYTVRLWPILAN